MTCAVATDLKIKKMKIPPAAEVTNTEPVIKPAVTPTIDSEVSKLPADNAIEMQKAPVALPSSQSQEIQITNQKWEDVKNLPDSTVLINQDGSRTTLGEVKAVKQKPAPALTPTLSKKNVLSKAPAINNQRVDTESILATENAAASAAIVSTSNTTKDNSAITFNCDPCISRVNGKDASRVVFTPGTAESAAKYTISGRGFGARQGSVYLSGGFNKRPTLRVDSWRDDQITAYFEAGFTKELDRKDIKTVVKMPNGSLIESAGNAKFYATRAQTTIGLDKIPDSRIKYDTDSAMKMDKDATSYKFLQIDSSKPSLRGFTDVINLNNQGLLKPGFAVVSATANIEEYLQNGRYTDKHGCDGSTRSIGENRIAWVGDDLQIKRPMNYLSMNPISATGVEGKFRDAVLASVSLGLFGKLDIHCTELSRYETGYHSMVSDISIVVEGPVGFAPF